VSVRILVGDARAVLATLPAESVHMVCTSPPYWGLRDYGLPPTVWGGEAGCAHAWGEEIERPCPNKERTRIHLRELQFGIGMAYGKQVEGAAATDIAHLGAFCSHCGAWRGALGLEPTPEAYVAHLVEVFRAVRRVLREDGTCWVNLGDSYSSIGWRPGGAIGVARPCVVLDPFAGAGTVGLVADRLGRDAILIELKPEYAAMAERRIREEAPLLTAVEIEAAASAGSDNGDGWAAPEQLALEIGG
jgi:DNA modification methylase